MEPRNPYLCRPPSSGARQAVPPRLQILRWSRAGDSPRSGNKGPPEAVDKGASQDFRQGLNYTVRSMIRQIDRLSTRCVFPGAGQSVARRGDTTLRCKGPRDPGHHSSRSRVCLCVPDTLVRGCAQSKGIGRQGAGSSGRQFRHHALLSYALSCALPMNSPEGQPSFVVG